MEKEQDLEAKEKADTKKRKEKSGPPEKKSRALELQRLDDPKLAVELAKMGAITPYSVSSQFNVRIGAARNILAELERRKVLKSVGGNARLKIYQAVAA